MRPLPLKNSERAIPDSQHPAGLYARGGQQFVLNLGTALPPLKAMDYLPLGVVVKQYDTTHEVDLGRYVLYAALLLFCVDWLVILVLMGMPFMPSKLRRRHAALALVLCALFLSSSPALAQNAEQDVQHANGFYLAYVRTGDNTLDATTQAGARNPRQNPHRPYLH